MSKKTLIISQKQLDEICGGNSAYLDGLATKPDLANNFASEITADGSVEDGYADPTTSDDVAHDLTNDWRGNAKLHGMGPITVREMTVKEWKEKYLGESKTNEVGDTLKGQKKLGRLSQKRSAQAMDAVRKAINSLDPDEEEKYNKQKSDYMKRSTNAYVKARNERDAKSPSWEPNGRKMADAFRSGEKKQKRKGVAEEKEHGNERLKNVQFGASNGEKGKSYDATKMALSRKRAAENNLINGSTPEIKQKAAKTLQRMKNNWNGIDVAETQYNAAKAADKTVQANKAPGTIRKTDNIMKPSNGVFTSE